MAGMERDGRSGRALTAVLAALGTAGLFEAATVLATQDRAVRAASPWQDDPYDVVVSHSQVAVPMLALVIGLRLLAWRAPGGPDRARQAVRAAAAMTALVGATVVTEWAAVAGGARASTWRTSRGGWTAALIGGLAVATVLAALTTALLARCRQPGGLAPRWRHDWLGDAVALGGRVPVLRRWATQAGAARV